MKRPTATTLPPVDRLNRLGRAEFQDALSALFEAHGPLGEGLWLHRPFDSYEDLLDHAAEVVAGLSEAERVEVVNGHPRLGEPAAELKQRSEISFHEQGGEDEDETRREERLLLHELCFEYEVKFGFRCVVFVNGRPPAVLVGAVRERMDRPRDEELETALGEVLAIARDRLQRLDSSTPKG